MFDSGLVEQRCVAEVVSHHDGGVERSKVEGSNRGVIVSGRVNGMSTYAAIHGHFDTQIVVSQINVISNVPPDWFNDSGSREL